MLNDPFEFRFKLKNERSLSEKRQGEYELNVEDGQSGLSAKINAHCMVVKFLINPQTMQHTYDRLEKQNQKMGVFSLSKDPKGILMWAHYADAHRGICVGIKPQFKVLLEKGRTLNGFPKEVLYPLRNEYPVIDVYPTDDDAKKSMLSKSIDWKYEKEWRLILAEEKGGVVEWKNGPLRLRDNAISEIIVGCEMEIGGDDEMAVREWVSEIEGGENIQFMRAKRHPSEYALEIKPIE